MASKTKGLNLSNLSSLMSVSSSFLATHKILLVMPDVELPNLHVDVMDTLVAGGGSSLILDHIPYCSPS